MKNLQNFRKGNNINTKCIVCNNLAHQIIWNDRIRVSSTRFSNKKEKIIKCLFCNLVSLKKKNKHLEDSSISRNIFNKNNSIKEFFNFHYKREKKKLIFIKKHLNVKNQSILESNCGAGILINYLKKFSKITAGVDSLHYKDFLIKNEHLFFKNFNDIKEIKFDIIFSLSEIEHKFDPIIFLKKVKKVLKKNGTLVIRVPNYYNVYMFLLGYNFFKYDYRLSHNFYFSEKNLDILFSNKLNLKIVKKLGFNEYPLNHLAQYLKTQKRVYSNKKYKNIFNGNIDKITVANIESSLTATSLIYFLKK